MIAGVLLAAGAASRFGGAKLLAPWRDGLAVAACSARNLAAAVDATVAVVRPGDDVLAGLLADQGLRVVVCPDAAHGMGASLACGIAATGEDVDGWLVALADMPRIRPDTLMSLVRQLHDGALIAAPFLGGQRGNPVALARPLRAELLQLTGDVGARDVIRRHADLMVRVTTDDRGVLQDIDTPADLAALQALERAARPDASTPGSAPAGGT